MRKLFTTIAFMMLSVGVAMAMTAADKKDDKKGDKDKDSEKHQPVLIIIWEPAWPPVFRAISLQDAMDICQPSEIE